MNENMSLWAEIMTIANRPLSLVSLMLLIGMTWIVSNGDFAATHPESFSAILCISIIGVFIIVFYQIASTNSRVRAVKAKEAIILAETLGTCVASASHPHISNLEISEERVQAYVRLAAYIKGQDNVTNSEFRSMASKAIIHYAYTQGGCRKSDIDICMNEFGL